MSPFPTVATRSDITLATLAQAVADAHEPIVFKGVVRDWPSVRASQTSADALIDYLKACDNGAPAATFRQPPGDGKFFYNSTIDGFTFQRGNLPLSVTLERLRQIRNQSNAEHVYIQSAPVKDHLPRMKAENQLPCVDAEPRIWIGNTSITQIHFDLSENLVCMIGGEKRFILFPPDQLPNLYMGPFERTVSNVPTSMASLENPDFTAHPRFAEALKAATVADLEPGDVLYIPYMWWHHVVSSGGFNVQMNYWWNPALDIQAAGGQPMQALVLAMLAVRDLPEDQRDAWKGMFDHFVFQKNGPPAEHLPPDRRGLMGDMTFEQRLGLRKHLGQNLAED
ncbi:hypothetical protein ABAC460_19495 [Asticcacaulis sp. AC460]|uniref:cupin-like domain-containing protein n=1 Tax=Asticcacaulis sp. AC460 TaxID=1282360 RepID=UPI0003C3B3C7|nr:cupin-like domain-containing protein [Asticcacaulis sp. AC460]ESQ87514.1 hypothetical protein ABAC460_19495 [Asticcacaulis sp. AC460]